MEFISALISLRLTRSYVLTWTFVFLSLITFGQAIVPYQSIWKYAPESNTTPGTNWYTEEFNDTNWKSGQAPLGFSGQDGPSRNTTLISGENNRNYPVYYFRKTVTISNTETIRSLRLNANYDDGLVVYINGVQILSENMEQNPTPGEEAYYGYPVNSGNFINVSKVLNANLLHIGTNLIAVRLHQKGSGSSDVYFDMELTRETPAITRYPYLQLPSYDQMTVRWYTNIPTATTVRYSTNMDYSGYKEYYSSAIDTMHNATLKNLLYNTKYYYQVGYGAGDNFVAMQSDPSVNVFRTLPPPYQKSEPMRFWLLGDSGAGKANNPRPYYVRDAYLNYLQDQGNPEVHSILFLGDNSNGDEGTQNALDGTFFKFYNRPFNDQPEIRQKQLLSHMPSWTVMGNHDYGPDRVTKNIPGQKSTSIIRKDYYRQEAASFSAFSFPENGEIGGEPTNTKKGYYSFDQGDIHFVVLNPYLIETPSEMWATPFTADIDEVYGTNSISLDNKYDSSIDNLVQVKWLKRDLEQNTKKWTVVTFHQPPFSTIGHFSEPYLTSVVFDDDLKRIKEKLMPILEKPEYRVDLVLVSHSHAYLRAGMIRIKDGQTRITDYQKTKNLGRYPTQAPYIKTGNEPAYSYILTGSSGRGVKREVIGLDGNSIPIDDGGYTDTDIDKVRPVAASTPPMDDLKANDTKFYHELGGSTELLFRENRLDVKFIREKDNGNSFSIDDSFVVMKDVNKKTTLTIQNGGDVAQLKASWVGDEYIWYSSESPNTAIASGVRELTLGPVKNTTYYVRDNNGYLADTFVVNVVNTQPNPTGDTLIGFGTQWLYPLSAGISSKGINLNEQCVADWNFVAPPFEIPGSTIIGLGHDDEQTRVSNHLIEKIIIPAERLWFRRSFILNGSPSTYTSFKLTLLQDKNTTGRKSYYTTLQAIYINGQVAEIKNSTALDVLNGRTEITYTLGTNGFKNGVNYILISHYLTPRSPMMYPIDASSDPFTFDAQLLSVPSQLAPPPSSKQFFFKKEAIASRQVCAGDSLNVPFLAQGNESGFPIVYEAQLVTATGSIAMAEGMQSPIRVKMPSDVEEGTYRIKVVTKSAFMDQVETSEVKVKVAPGAAISPGPIASIWKGQTFKLPITFTGSGPWDYTLSDGTKGTVFNAEQGIEVKPGSPTTYIIRSVSNSCGVGTSTGSFQIDVKEPSIATNRVNGFTTATQKTAICAGDSISIAYSVIGPDATRTFVAELSDPQGSFTSPVTLGTGTTNPFLVKLPTTASESDLYKVRIKAQNPDVDFTLSDSEALQIRKAASASFTVNKETILSNEEVAVSLDFTGSAPWYYFLRYGADTMRGNVTASSLQRIVTPKQTSIFSLDSVRNSCGYGLVSGNRTVTVTLLVSVNPLYDYGISVYPNPTSERLLLTNKQPWNGSIQWSITEMSGKAVKRGVVQATQNKTLEIDIHSLTPGQYLLQVSEGEQFKTWKVVKH